MLKEETGAFDGARAHDWQIISQTRYLLRHATPLVSVWLMGHLNHKFDVHKYAFQVINMYIYYCWSFWRKYVRIVVAKYWILLSLYCSDAFEWLQIHFNGYRYIFHGLYRYIFHGLLYSWAYKTLQHYKVLCSTFGSFIR